MEHRSTKKINVLFNYIARSTEEPITKFAKYQAGKGFCLEKIQTKVLTGKRLFLELKNLAQF